MEMTDSDRIMFEQDMDMFFDLLDKAPVIEQEKFWGRMIKTKDLANARMRED